MKRTLIVVDMQNDFIDMALGTKEAIAIVPNVKKRFVSMQKEEMRLSLPEIHIMQTILKLTKVNIFLLNTVLEKHRGGKSQMVL